MLRAAAIGVLLALTAAAGADAAPLHREIIGRSVDGRAIRAIRVGTPDAARTALVVGCVHGTERAGEAVTRRLRGAHVPGGVAVWLIDQANPDGCRTGVRQNAHGVDLNRNAPWHWRSTGPLGSTYYAGPRARSEPETRALLAFIARVRPAVAIWYHQRATLVDDPGRHRAIPRRYARTVGLPFRRYGDDLPGILTGWQNATLPRTTAFVVELPAGPLRPASVRRHARAVLDAASAAPSSGREPKRRRRILFTSWGVVWPERATVGHERRHRADRPDGDRPDTPARLRPGAPAAARPTRPPGSGRRLDPEVTRRLPPPVLLEVR